MRINLVGSRVGSFRPTEPKLVVIVPGTDS